MTTARASGARTQRRGIWPVVLLAVAACGEPRAPRHVGSDLRDDGVRASRAPSPAASGSNEREDAGVPIGAASASAPRERRTGRVSAFPPAPITTPVDRTKKPGDGIWSALAVAGMDPSPLATTVIHPHKIKPFVIVAIVAIDLSRLSLQLVAGVDEPKSDDVPPDHRTGLIPATDLAELVAAMNGGFKRRHGEHGMRIGADHFVPPKDDSCTLGRTADGAIRIASWSRLAASDKDLTYYRQGPPCLVEDGAKNGDTEGGYTVKKWGASETGDREIRRSAFALSKDGETLYFAIGDWINPATLADALVAAHVESAVQLDINYSFTRFVRYERDAKGEPVATSPLLSKLKFSATEYWKEPSFRDFFYLTKIAK